MNYKIGSKFQYTKSKFHPYVFIKPVYHRLVTTYFIIFGVSNEGGKIAYPTPLASLRIFRGQEFRYVDVIFKLAIGGGNSTVVHCNFKQQSRDFRRAIICPGWRANNKLNAKEEGRKGGRKRRWKEDGRGGRSLIRCSQDRSSLCGATRTKAFLLLSHSPSTFSHSHDSSRVTYFSALHPREMTIKAVKGLRTSWLSAGFHESRSP